MIRIFLFFIFFGVFFASLIFLIRRIILKIQNKRDIERIKKQLDNNNNKK